MSDRPEGGCCGAGEACSSAACTGTPSVTRGGIQFGSAIDEPRTGVAGEACDPTSCAGGCSPRPREVFPEPRSDAAVFGAPRAPMYGGRDEDGL